MDGALIFEPELKQHVTLAWNVTGGIGMNGGDTTETEVEQNWPGGEYDELEVRQ